MVLDFSVYFLRPMLSPIWHAPDEMWQVIKRILAEIDPPNPIGRSRIDPRAAFDAMIYRIRTGIQWNQLPKEYPDDSSVHRTFQRWLRLGFFERIWQLWVQLCDLLQLVDWEWQAVDCSLHKARFGGIKWVPIPPIAEKMAPKRASSSMGKAAL